MLSDRERFLAMLPGPPLRSDVIVVLAGEDGPMRAAFAAHAFRENSEGVGGAIFVTGGRDDAPRAAGDPPQRHFGASAVAAMLMGHGIAPRCIRTDDDPQNTREQAVSIVDAAMTHGWRRIGLVASPYHMPRAVLTLVRALNDAKQDDAIQVVRLSAMQAPWNTCPPGTTETRDELLTREWEKIAEYQRAGHVEYEYLAVQYFRAWEGR